MCQVVVGLKILEQTLDKANYYRFINVGIQLVLNIFSISTKRIF